MTLQDTGSQMRLRTWPLPATQHVAAFVLLAVWYLGTRAVNHVESIDGTTYSLTAETVPVGVVTDTRSLLFHVVNRLLTQFADVLVPGIRAYDVICVLTALCGAAAVVLAVRLLQRAFGLSATASWAGGLLLGFAYGFWRYAGEVEVYVPSMLLILGVLNVLAAAGPGERLALPRLAAAGAIAGLSVLYYQPNAIPLVLAMPVLLLARTGVSGLAIYLAASGSVITSGLVAAYYASGPAELTVVGLIEFVTSRNAEFLSHRIGLKGLLTIPAIVGHHFASMNWLLAFEPISERLTSLYPERFLLPRVYAVEHMRPISFLPVLLLPALIAVAVALVMKAFRSGRRPALSAWHAFALTWLVLICLVNGYLDPGSVEVWIMALPPLVLLAAAAVIAPNLAAGRSPLLWVALALLVAHNFAGGIGLWLSRTGDYFHARTLWLQQHAGARDVVLFGENNNDRRTSAFIRYFNGLNVLRTTVDGTAYPMGGVPRTLPLADALTEVRARGGRVFVLGEFFRYDPVLAARRPERKATMDKALELANRLKPSARLVDQGPLGEIYELVAPSAGAQETGG